jgi:hypothetical protein
VVLREKKCYSFSFAVVIDGIIYHNIEVTGKLILRALFVWVIVLAQR